MKKLLALIIFFLSASLAIGQVVTPPSGTGNINTLSWFRGAIKADSGLVLAMTDTAGFGIYKRSIVISISDSNFYYWNGLSYERLLMFSDTLSTIATKSDIPTFIGTNLSSTKVGVNVTVNSSTGTGTTFSVADNDNSSTNEIQTLSRTGGNINLSLSGGSVVDSNHKYSVGSGLSMSGTYPNYNIINTAPDQTVTITGEGGTSVSGSYPSFTVFSTDSNSKYSAGTGLSVSGSYPNYTLTNTGDLSNTNEIQTISRTGPNLNLSLGGGNVVDSNHKYAAGTGITITGTYPNYTINANGGPVIDTTSLSNRIDQKQPYSDTSTWDATRSWVNGQGFLTSEVDGSITNELQNLGLGLATSISRGITISDGASITLPAVTTTSAGLMSAADKIKLNGISTGAEVNVQSDWSVTDAGSDAFILNKPTIPSLTGYVQFSDTVSTIATKSDIPSFSGTNLGSSSSGNNRTITSSTGTGTTINIADGDSSITNELQTVSRSGNTITLSNSGGSFVDSNHKYQAGSNVSITGTYPNYTISSTNTVIDTASLSTRINERVKYSDTASMLIPYLRKADTVNLSNRIDARQKYSDTLTVDATRFWVGSQGYLTSEIDGSTTNEIQTISRSGNNLNLSLSGGSVVDSNHKYTAGSNVSITGSYPNYTISSTNTIIDTTSISSRIDQRVKYSDTTTMLSGYLRKTDTNSLSNRIELRQKYSDTLTSDATRYWVNSQGYLLAEVDGSVTNEIQTLSRSGNTLNLSLGGGSVVDSNHKYQAGSNVSITGSYPNYTISSTNTVVDTSSLSARIDARVKYTDTSSMLSGYLRAARTLTINGTTYDLTANRSWTVGDIVSSGSYANPSWITSLAWSKITGAPTIGNGTLTLSTGTGLTGSATFTANQTGSSSFTVGLNASLNNLNDVSISSPSTGQLLRYNGSSWANWTPNYLTINPNLQTVAGIGNFTNTNIDRRSATSGTTGSPAYEDVLTYSTSSGVYPMSIQAFNRFGSSVQAGWRIQTRHNATTLRTALDINSDASITLPQLTGIGLRMLTVNSDGLLSASTIPTFDSSSLSTRIDARVKYTDTAAMLSGYLTDEVDPKRLTTLGVTGTTTKTITATLADASTVTTTFTDLNTTYSGSTSITLSGSSFQRAALTGDVTAGTNSNSTTIATNVVTFAKMQDIPTQTLIGRYLGGTGDPQAISIGEGLIFNGIGELTTNILSGEVTWGSSIAVSSGASYSFSPLTVTGALVSDVVVCTQLPDFDMVMVKAAVTASNTVKITILNLGSGSVSIPAGIIKIKIIK